MFVWQYLFRIRLNLVNYVHRFDLSTQKSIDLGKNLKKTASVQLHFLTHNRLSFNNSFILNHAEVFIGLRERI